MAGAFAGIGKRLSHVAVSPDCGAVLLHAPSAGNTRKKQAALAEPEATSSA